MIMFFITPTEPGHMHSPDCPCQPRLIVKCRCGGKNPDCHDCGGSGDRPIDWPEDGCCLAHNQMGKGPVQWEVVQADAEIEECHENRN